MAKNKGTGLKLTPQRLAILKFLEGNEDHPSADQVHKAVLKKFPTMSLATVYNTLETLRKLNRVTELHCDPLKKRFDPDPAPHHHLVCVICLKILDLPNELSPGKPKIGPDEFEILGNHIEYYGICSKCKNKKET